MAHFAQIDSDDRVIQVIVAEQDFIDSGAVGDPASWIQTSYNTRAGVHVLGGTPLRKNYAGIGYTYNRSLDAFVPPQPFASWTLDTATATWSAPVPYPTDGAAYYWSEDTQSWQQPAPLE
jgi:hypothetical protein